MSTYRGSPLRVLEAYEDSPRSKCIVKKDEVPLETLDKWLEQKYGPDCIASTSPHPPGLRLICCNFSALSLTAGTDTLKRICAGFKLHWTTPEAFNNNNGTFAKHVSRSPSSSSAMQMSLVVRVPHFVIGSYGLSLVYDSTTKCTKALLYGYTDADFTNLSEYLSSKHTIHSLQNPLLLATHLLQSYRSNAETYRAKIDACIYRTELALGYAVPGSLQYADLSPGKLDFERFVQKLHSCHDDFMRKLHTCQTELGALTHTANFGREYGLFLQQIAHEIGKMHDGTFEPEEDGKIAANEEIVHSIDFQTNLWWTLLSQMAILKERTQTHINLMFSLIAQDENRLSRSVAQKSEMIAAASKKDSAAMKTLAVLTTVFLPPTFVATFFSMSMFDWTSDSMSTLTTSKYLWIYWAVAVPLTALVLITWRLWWDMEERKYQRELRKEK